MQILNIILTNLANEESLMPLGTETANNRVEHILVPKQAGFAPDLADNTSDVYRAWSQVDPMVSKVVKACHQSLVESLLEAKVRERYECGNVNRHYRMDRC